jgi:Spy/CpxP family protein refolding chaperone
MIRTIIVISAIAVLGLGSALFIGCRHGGPNRGAAFMMDYLTEALDLNEAQQAKADAIKDEILAKAQAMHPDKKQMHDEIKAQLGNAEIDITRVKELVVEHRAKMDEMIDLVVNRVAEFHRTLSPEQRDKLIAKLEKFEKWHHHEWNE